MLVKTRWLLFYYGPDITSMCLGRRIVTLIVWPLPTPQGELQRGLFEWRKTLIRGTPREWFEDLVNPVDSAAWTGRDLKW